MSPDPRCANCGAQVAPRGSLRASFHLIRDTPVVAWCSACLDADPLAAFVFHRRIGHEAALRVIAARGPGRVVLAEQPQAASA